MPPTTHTWLLLTHDDTAQLARIDASLNAKDASHVSLLPSSPPLTVTGANSTLEHATVPPTWLLEPRDRLSLRTLSLVLSRLEREGPLAHRGLLDVKPHIVQLAAAQLRGSCRLKATFECKSSADVESALKQLESDGFGVCAAFGELGSHGDFCVRDAGVTGDAFVPEEVEEVMLEIPASLQQAFGLAATLYQMQLEAEAIEEHCRSVGSPPVSVVSRALLGSAIRVVQNARAERKAAAAAAAAGRS